MNSDIAAPRIGAGAAAGLVGTALVQGLMAGSQKWAPQSLPPIKQDPGEFMVKKAEEQLPDKMREQIPEQLEKAAAKTLAFGYGTAFGALYATSRPETKSLLLEGGALFSRLGCRLSRLAAGNRPNAGSDEARAAANRRAHRQSYPIWHCNRRTLSSPSANLIGITCSSSCALSDYPNSSEVKNETSQSSAAGIRDDRGHPCNVRCGIGTPARRQVLRNETETARLDFVFGRSAEHDPLGL